VLIKWQYFILENFGNKPELGLLESI